eukprot:4444778-Pyramimonas_sp.AAC.2
MSIPVAMLVPVAGRLAVSCSRVAHAGEARCGRVSGLATAIVDLFDGETEAHHLATAHLPH